MHVGHHGQCAMVGAAAPFWPLQTRAIGHKLAATSLAGSQPTPFMRQLPWDPPPEVPRGRYLRYQGHTALPLVPNRPYPLGNLTSISLVGAISTWPKEAGNGPRRPSGPKKEQTPSCLAA